MKITDIRRVFSLTGSHCAFTDIISFGGCYYLGFMAGVEHMVNPENKGVVLKSPNGINWSLSALFGCKKDTREPKFAVIGGRLFAYFFTIEPAPGENRMITDSWYSFTEDGLCWSSPVRFAQEVKYWRPAAFGGAVYCVTHPKDPSPEGYCRLMRSEDGMHWSFLSNLPVEPMEKPNEAAIAFGETGTLHIFIRTDRGRCHAYYLSSEPPYTEYRIHDLGCRLGGPLIWLEEGQVRLGARFYTEGGCAHTGIFRLDEQFHPQLLSVLPSMGDSSYMGITRRMQEEGYLISYYSSHESLGGDHFAHNHASVYLCALTPDESEAAR